MKPVSPDWVRSQNPRQSSRIITSYDPTRRLQTADKSLMNNLNETFKLRENLTEEEVLSFFDDVLAGFTEDDKEETKLVASMEKYDDKSYSKRNMNEEFYFEKSNFRSSQQKIHEIKITQHKQKKSTTSDKQSRPSLNNATESKHRQESREVNRIKNVKVSIERNQLTPLSIIKHRVNPNNNSPGHRDNYINDSSRKTSCVSSSSQQKISQEKKSRNEYTIELFKTNTAVLTPPKLSTTKIYQDKSQKQNRVKDRDGHLTKEQFSQQNEQLMKIVENISSEIIPNSWVAYKTVKGFDSFMMY